MNIERPGDPDGDAVNALRLLGPDPPNWVPERPGIDHDVTIVGGGQTGCAVAFALRRAGIGRATVIDAAADAAAAGVWLNAARMNVLRTPKSLPGPELGIPALGFRSWYEARHGRAAYAAMERIPRTAWAEYLAWYRHLLAIAVRYRTRLLRIEPAAGHFRLHLVADGRATLETTRKIVLANGVAGNGGPYVPPALRDALPRRCYVHTADPIDFDALRGKFVAVIGAAASAFDAAGAALEAGAASLRLLARRPRLASLPVARTRGYPGAYDNYDRLPDRARWHQAIRFRRAGSTPPSDAIERAVRFPNFHLHLGAPIVAAREEAGMVVLETQDAAFRCDFVIAGTGYFVDPSALPELAGIAPQILLWRDRFVPPSDEEDPYLGAHPYLGFGYEYLEKEPGAAPYLKDIHVLNPAGFVSFGWPVGDVPSMKRGIPTVVSRIGSDLFLADLDHHERRLTAAVVSDFDDSLYQSAVSRHSITDAAAGMPSH